MRKYERRAGVSYSKPKKTIMQQELDDMELITSITEEMYRSIFGFNELNTKTKDKLVDEILGEFKLELKKESDMSMFGRDLSISDFLYIKYKNPVRVQDIFLVHYDLANIAPIYNKGLLGDIVRVSVQTYNEVDSLEKRDELILKIKSTISELLTNPTNQSISYDIMVLVDCAMKLSSSMNINFLTFLNNFTYSTDTYAIQDPS